LIFCAGANAISGKVICAANPFRPNLFNNCSTAGQFER
jgi:hypothetical protein